MIQMKRYISRIDFVIGLIAVVLILVALSGSFPVRAQLGRVSDSDVNELQAVVTASQSLDAKWFWQWRDKTNGVFTFDTATTRAGMTRRILEPTEESWLLHSFSSELVSSSTDTLLRSQFSQDTILSDLMADHADEYGSVIARGTDFVVLANADRTMLLLLFVKESEVLIEVDGLFDFVDSERKFLQDSYWVNTTYISL